jgi:hypothetical protein
MSNIAWVRNWSRVIASALALGGARGRLAGIIALTAAGEGLTGQADAKTDGLVRPADAEGECLGADAEPDGLVGPADAEGECLDDAPKELSALRVGEPEDTPLPPRQDAKFKRLNCEEQRRTGA